MEVGVKKMNRIKLGLMIFFVLTLFSQLVFAQIQFESASFIGSGCPQRSKLDFVPTTTVLVSDNRIYITFDEFIVDSAKKNKSNCKILIPVKVAENYTISLEHLTTEGYLKQSIDSETLAKTEVRFSNKPTSQFQLKKDWVGMVDESFNLKNVATLADTRLWSDCGKKDFFVVLEYEIDFNVKAKDDSNFATFDHSEYQVQWRYCK
jgi:hypothetical protein